MGQDGELIAVAAEEFRRTRAQAHPERRLQKRSKTSTRTGERQMTRGGEFSSHGARSLHTRLLAVES
jgi:hypothetical protein